MKAETAFNVCKALPPDELQRLLAMLSAEQAIAVPPKPKKGHQIWTHAECFEIIYKQLQDRKARKRNETVGNC